MTPSQTVFSATKVYKRITLWNGYEPRHNPIVGVEIVRDGAKPTPLTLGEKFGRTVSFVAKHSVPLLAAFANNALFNALPPLIIASLPVTVVAAVPFLIPAAALLTVGYLACEAINAITTPPQGFNDSTTFKVLVDENEDVNGYSVIVDNQSHKFKIGEKIGSEQWVECTIPGALEHFQIQYNSSVTSDDEDGGKVEVQLSSQPCSLTLDFVE